MKFPFGRARAAGVVLHNDKILLMFRHKRGRLFAVLPGGGVEDFETPSRAAEREILEETSVVVLTKRPLYTMHESSGQVQDIFLCEYQSGEAKLPKESQEAFRMNEENAYEPRFVPLSKLSDLPLVPETLKNQLIHDLEHGFPARTLVFAAGHTPPEQLPNQTLPPKSVDNQS